MLLQNIEASEPLEPSSDEMMQALDEVSHMFREGLISQRAYDAMLLDIYHINTAARISDDAYYPEVKSGDMDRKGVVYLYEEGLTKAATVNAAPAGLIGAMPGAGRGLSVIGVIAAAGGKSSFEKAVNKAYFAKKGIGVYYQIHHAVQSFNRVRYVVE